MNLTAEQKAKAKGEGFLLNRGGELFSARIITGNGVMTEQEMRTVSEAAKRFGNGQMAFTVRLTVEIQGISYENIEPLKEFLAKGGLETGGTGKRVRPVVACKGTVCVFGIIDTQGIAQEIHRRFYEGYSDVTLPHKFKIAVGGCQNSCAKPDLNDFGIVGHRVPHKDKESGKCCKLYIGGRWGKVRRFGDLLDGIYTPEEAMDILERTILFYKENGLPGERFGATIDRLGFEYVQGELLV